MLVIYTAWVRGEVAEVLGDVDPAFRCENTKVPTCSQHSLRTSILKSQSKKEAMQLVDAHCHLQVGAIVESMPSLGWGRKGERQCLSDRVSFCAGSPDHAKRCTADH